MPGCPRSTSTPEMQVEALRAAGCEEVFTDHGISGTKASRPAAVGPRALPSAGRPPAARSPNRASPLRLRDRGGPVCAHYHQG